MTDDVLKSPFPGEFSVRDDAIFFSLGEVFRAEGHAGIWPSGFSRV